MNRYFIKTSFAKILLLIFAVSLTAKEPIRTWTSMDGRTLEARFLKMIGDKVRIENASGRKFTFPLNGFSKIDQKYVKKAYELSLFADPQPFDDQGRGGVIVASAKGKVEVLVPPRSRYSKTKPKFRAVVYGESLASGAILKTSSGASADLLLTNGTLAHLAENTKLVLTALYQKNFKGSDQKASELEKEVSPSRTALKLEEGELVLEVRKLGKESSFLISTKMAQAGIRGTQFKVSASADSAELAVLEGRVDFLDTDKMVTAVETERKTGIRKGLPAKLEKMSVSELKEVKQAIEKSKKASRNIDLNRMANTVDGYAPKPNYIVKSALDMELIWCPPGSFIMGPGQGWPGQGRGNGDSPAHSVVLTQGFYLGKYEVTQEQYKKITGKNPSFFKTAKHPVVNVSWNDAVSFCQALTKKESKQGWKFVLPTEAQWEYACRAGSTTSYSWGDEINPKRANYKGSGLEKAMRVGSYQANPWGFFDMHGNVWEWCRDWIGPYPKGLTVDPVGAGSGSSRVYRGGSWDREGNTLKSIYRGRYSPKGKMNPVGFRVAFKQVD